MTRTPTSLLPGVSESFILPWERYIDDFLEEQLSNGLQQVVILGAGYSEEAKTIFIWQGVTYFLTNEGFDSTLAFIAEHSGKGSIVIFIA